jgi:hypothetical protein
MENEVSNNNLLQDIDKLKQKFSDPAYPEDLETISQWEKSIKRAMIKDSMHENEALKEVVRYAREALEQIDFVLLNADGLTKEERDVILLKKKMHRWYLQLLDPEEKIMDELKKNVQDALKNTG